jgi:hypothetical protein
MVADRGGGKLEVRGPWPPQNGIQAPLKKNIIKNPATSRFFFFFFIEKKGERTESESLRRTAFETPRGPRSSYTSTVGCPSIDTRTTTSS